MMDKTFLTVLFVIQNKKSLVFRQKGLQWSATSPKEIGLCGLECPSFASSLLETKVCRGKSSLEKIRIA